MNGYSEFIERKKQISGLYGFEPNFIPDFLFDFQEHLLVWALKKGKGAVFADTGLGKTPMQLCWAENVVRKTNKNVLILAPLAVSHQTVLEGEKFNIDVKRSRDGLPKGKITITNYQQLAKFNANDYIGIVCDESSILKNFSGATKTAITRFTNKMPYRSLWTATPSPNDYTELGTSSEALGELKYMDMLVHFFRDTSNDKNPQWSTPKYILKGHAVHNFWKWVSSWARAIKKPSDLGYSNDRFELPELIEKDHVLKVTQPLPGELFVRKAKTLRDQRAERKITLEARAEKTKDIVKNYPISVIWAHYNYEADYLEKYIPDSLQISGADSDEVKEEKFILFAKGEISNLIIKPQIGSFGLNWQHCNHMVFYPSHSYEQYYQGVRRCWRFGQKKSVHIDIITTEGELGVFNNIKRKSEEAKEMFKKLVIYMNDELKLEQKEHNNKQINLPEWI